MRILLLGYIDTMLHRLRESVSLALLEEQERWLLWFPVAMGLGVLLYFQLPYEPHPRMGLAALALSLPALWRWKRFFLLRAILLAVFAAALGFSAAEWQRMRVDAPVLHKQSRIAYVQGHLAEIIDTDGGMKLVIENPVLMPSLRGGEADAAIQGGIRSPGLLRSARNDAKPLPQKIRLNLRKPDATLQAGQTIRLRAGLFPLPPPALPDGFDFTRHFYFQGIGAVGFGLAPVQIVREGKPERWREWLFDLRHRFGREIRAIIPGAEGAIANALMTGEQASIPDSVRDAMAVAGIAHVLSISGLHLSLAAGIFFISFRFLLALLPGFALRYPIKKWSAVLALASSFVYLALAGFPVAANRSFVMVALVLCAVLLDRQVLSLRSVALAAILMLLWMPESLLGPSFQLSFAATIAIVALYETYRRVPLSQRFYDSWLLKPWIYLSGIVLTSLAAGLATTPYVMMHFHQFTIYHILANLLTAPIISVLVMPMVLLTALGMAVGITGPFAFLLGWSITQIIAIAEWVAALPLAVSYAPTYPGWGIAMFTFGALWLCCWRRRWRMIGMPLMLVGLVSPLSTQLPDIVISPKGEQVAIRTDEEGYVMAKGGQRNFTAQIWAESLGVEAFGKPADLSALKCDAEGCLLEREGFMLALPQTRQAAAEDCRMVDIIIADFYSDACPKARHHFFRPKQATALWLHGDGVRVEQARSFVSRFRTQ